MTNTALQNKKIVITRATHQAGDFADKLLTLGAVPVLYPCIAITPPADTTELDRALGQLVTFNWLLFTSPNTVIAVHERLSVLSLSPDWSKLLIGVVGSKTATQVKHMFGRDVDFMPDDFTAERLGASLPDVTDKHILLPQSVLADDSLAEALRQRGTTVVNLPAYENTIGQGGADVPAMLEDNQIDMLTFTSSSTVENFVKRIQPHPIPDVPAVCIGPSTAETATSCGFAQVLIPDTYTLDGMIQTIRQYFLDADSSSIL